MSLKKSDLIKAALAQKRTWHSGSYWRQRLLEYPMIRGVHPRTGEFIFDTEEFLFEMKVFNQPLIEAMTQKRDQTRAANRDLLRIDWDERNLTNEQRTTTRIAREDAKHHIQDEINRLGIYDALWHAYQDVRLCYQEVVKL